MSGSVHECVLGRLAFFLMPDGKMTVRNMETGRTEVRPWYSDSRSGKPWFPRKARNFKSLVAQADRDGEYDDLKAARV